MDTAQRLRSAREALGLSSAAAGRLVGVPGRQIRRWEAGRVSTHGDLVARVLAWAVEVEGRIDSEEITDPEADALARALHSLIPLPQREGDPPRSAPGAGPREIDTDPHPTP
jgi:transcriptional regulator with XRE-family HTH domain